MQNLAFLHFFSILSVSSLNSFSRSRKKNRYPLQDIECKIGYEPQTRGNEIIQCPDEDECLSAARIVIKILDQEFQLVACFSGIIFKFSSLGVESYARAILRATLNKHNHLTLTVE